MNIVDIVQKHGLEDNDFKESCTLISASMSFFLELDFMPYLRAEMRLIDDLFRFEDECDLGEVLEAMKEFLGAINYIERNFELLTDSSVDLKLQHQMFLRTMQASVATISIALGFDDY